MTPEQRIHELYGATQVLRMLGFSADDIYVASNILDLFGRVCFGVLLKARGREFSIYVCPVIDMPGEKDIGNLWAAFVMHANENPEDTNLREIAHRSFSWKNKGMLVAALCDKGIEPPLGSN